MKFVQGILVLVVTFFASTAPVIADEIVDGEFDVPFVAFVACAGDGEFLEGISQFQFRLESTKDVSGKDHLGFYKESSGPVALGRKSGDLYDSDRMSRLSTNTTKTGLPFTDQFWHNFRMTGSDGVSQFNASQLVRVIVNAEGQLRAEVMRTRINCPVQK